MLDGMGERGWGGCVMDTGEGMCCGERCVLYKTDESRTCTPETNNTLYVNNNSKKLGRLGGSVG